MPEGWGRGICGGGGCSGWTLCWVIDVEEAECSGFLGFEESTYLKPYFLERRGLLGFGSAGVPGVSAEPLPVGLVPGLVLWG